MAKKEKVKKNRAPHYWRRCLSWTTYIASNGIQTGLIGYLTLYLTDSVLLSAAVVGTILALSRVFDGISDIIAGFIIDRTKTRWGNARPYTIFTLVMWAAVVALFSVPEIGTVGKITYAFIMYNLSDTVARTMLVASEPVHYKKGFTSEEQIDTVGTAGLISGIVSMVFNILLPILIAQFGVTKEGWTIVALAIAAPCGIMGIMKLFFLPEMSVEEIQNVKQETKTPVKTSLKALLHNPYVFLFNVALMLQYMTQGTGMYTYFFKYIVGDLAKFSVVGAFAMLSLVMMPLIPVCVKKFGAANFCGISLLVGGLANLLVFVDPTNLVILGISYTVNMLAILPISMLSTVMAIQCMKYSEWKDGIKIDGVISSVTGVATKVGRAVGAIATGFMLSLAGYDGALAVQSAGANNMIVFMYAGFPAILLILAAVCMKFYRADKLMPQIEADLDSRNRV